MKGLCFEIIVFLQNDNLLQDQEIESLQEIAGIITDSDMSPFEIIHSGLVGTLLTYLTAGDIALRDQHIRRFLLVMLRCKVGYQLLRFNFVFT